MKAATAAGNQVLAGRITQFQFRDIRPKAASEITAVEHASMLLGHIKGDITKRVHRRVGALAKPIRQEKYRKRFQNRRCTEPITQEFCAPQKRKNPRFVGGLNVAEA
ncbi:site-specific integrase [Pseudomonas phoenicis]|uniref:hypothetical protein n=1 Tax=unclassified Pseudomonas TaxID=196821 RepID=UPI0039A271E0